MIRLTASSLRFRQPFQTRLKFAAEPDSGSRQLQEKAGGVALAGFFSGRSKGLKPRASGASPSSKKPAKETAQCRKRAEGNADADCRQKAAREAEKVRPGEAASVQADV